MKMLSLLLCLTAFGTLSAQMVRMDAWPQKHQLYARDVITNLADIQIEGTVLVPGASIIHAASYRDGLLFDETTVPLVYSGDSAGFSIVLQQPAERMDYSYEIYLGLPGGSETLIRRTDSVVAGDAFLVHGQSNAFAARFFGASAKAFKDPYIRTYGRHGGGYLPSDTNWHMATGDGSASSFLPGAIGQWPLVMANRITTETGIPVAVINNAVGGMPISFFQKGDTTDLGLNYSILLHRLNLSGLRQHIRAMIWYQGESDATTVPNALAYGANFDQLYNDLHNDLGVSLERVLVCQIRQGCGAPLLQGTIVAELQRSTADIYSDVSIISTNGLDGHDGCHYLFERGYLDIGQRVALELAMQLYGLPPGPGYTAPNVNSAQYINAAQTAIAVELRDSSEILQFESGIEGLFHLSGGPEVTAVTQVGGKIIVQLAGSSSSDRLSFIGHQGSGPDVVSAPFKQGLFTFSINVEPFAVFKTDSPEKNTSSLTVAPNPTTGFIQVSFEALVRQTVRLTVTNSVGQLMYDGQHQAIEGLNRIHIQLAGVNDQLLFLQLNGENPTSVFFTH